MSYPGVLRRIREENYEKNKKSIVYKYNEKKEKSYIYYLNKLKRSKL